MITCLATLIYFLVFHRLDVKAIYSWDESLFATRAFYLAHHGEYFTNWKQVDHCNLPHPNTKPPLVGLIQAAFFKAFGYSRLALRMPIAILGAFLSIFLIFWSRKAKLGLGIGVIACLVLLSSNGFNVNHVLRSGDHDAALALWLTLSIFSAFQFSVSSKKNLWGILLFVFTAMAVLTKSIVGFMMLPPIAIFLFVTNKPIGVFKSWGLYVGLLLLLIGVSSFYLTIEARETGFLELVWQNEIGGRYGKTIDNHKGPWYFYLSDFFINGFNPYLWFVPLGIVVGFKSKNAIKRKLTLLLSLTSIFYFVLISIAETKLHWYAAPIYPLFSMLAAIGVSFIWTGLLAPKLKWKPIQYVLYILIIAPGVFVNINQNATENTSYKLERYEITFDRLRKQFPAYKNIKIHSRDEWYPSLVFVANKYSKIYDYQIELCNSKSKVEKGDLIFGEYLERLKHYNLEKIADFHDGIKLFRVLDTNS
ncbi:MAG: glycosyltransferase family 39 protein [Bacteroidia bacterium]